MTKSQAKAIEKIKRLGEDLFYGGKDNYEFKQFEVEEHDTFVYVLVCTGMKNDEGTMASIFCRDRARLFVGKKGGITYIDSKGNKKRFEGYSLLQAVIDQR